jgi:hypothetical protein
MQVIYLHAISCKHENALETKNLYGSYSKTIFYQNSKYEVHQIGPNYFRSQNFNFLVLMLPFLGLNLALLIIFFPKFFNFDAKMNEKIAAE